MRGPYDDIIFLPHYQSRARKHMAMKERAAQFAPFDALAGFDDAITESGRMTYRRLELDEEEKKTINARLIYLMDHPGEITVEITYFSPDPRKEGGSYLIQEGKIRRVDPTNRLIFFEGGAEIPMDEVISIKRADKKGEADDHGSP